MVRKMQKIWVLSLSWWHYHSLGEDDEHVIAAQEDDGVVQDNTEVDASLEPHTNSTNSNWNNRI